MTEKLMTELIGRFGTQLVRRSGGETYIYKAIVQLVTSKSWQNMERMVPNAGEIPRGQYLYIGPTAQKVKNGDVIEFDGRRFIVRRADRRDQERHGSAPADGSIALRRCRLR